MMKMVRRLAADTGAAAAAEMALVLPFMVALLFAAVELGNFFLSEHVVQKGVRDAARYAARLPMTDYAGCAATAGAQQRIQRVARTGDPDGAAGTRTHGWADDSTVSVTVACNTSGTYTGLYTEFPMGAPVVTVVAEVPYPSLFGFISTGDNSFMLNARSQAAVFGA